MMQNTTNCPLVLPLDDASATLEQVGGKGASLTRMVVAGLPVPPGFHITTAAYLRFIEEQRLQENILAAIAHVTSERPDTLEEAAQSISSLFAQSTMPEDIAEEIRRAYASLGAADLPVAVRSSATAEDLPEMSFAGQQETYLNMHGEAMVLDAVKRCWASLWTARAIGYRAYHNIPPQDVKLAVVIQALIPADIAGIMFTANPLTGSHGQVMINAAWGLGEAIVGGLVTPDTFIVEKATQTITEQQISEKEVMTIRTPDGTHVAAVPAAQRKQASLTPKQAAELTRIGMKIEKQYGQPMDIEWVLANEHISIVQARPITALPDAQNAATSSPIDQTAVEWKLPNPKGHYMRSSALELLPDPLTPLFETLGLPAWSHETSLIMQEVVAGNYPSDIFVTINGYGYYNVTYTPIQTLTLLLSMPRIAIVFPRLLRSSETRWQAERSKYVQIIKRWETRDLANTEANELLNGVSELTHEAARHYLSIQSGILPASYFSEALFTMAYDKLLKRHNAPQALTFLLGFDSTPIQAEKSLYDLARWVREQPALTDALHTISSEQFIIAYQEHKGKSQQTATDDMWATFWQRLNEHLSRFGHAIYDLDFAKPLLVDDPTPVLETLKFFLTDQAPDPYKRQKDAELAREKAMQTLLKGRNGLRTKLTRRLLRSAQRYAPLRENALADVGLGWPLVRQLLQTIGERLAAASAIATPNDVFWLTRDELREAAQTLDRGKQPADYQHIIAERHTIWKRERSITPPVALPLKGGARFMGIDFSAVMPARVSQPTDDVLKGIAASPGKINGPARVIHGTDEFKHMQQGDILVARITTPAWTPLFALASGVVTDVGGPLSHSSIVAREYHIPAVLGTGVATERLKSGQQITVDGDTGTVKVSN